MTNCEELVIKERKIFARNLRNARIDLGLSQEDLCHKTGLTQAFISRVETGQSNISMDNAKRLADAVHQPLWKLLNPSQL